MTTSSEISQRILEAVLAKKLLPGARLSEQQLAALFGCSRTIVREALTRLAVRKLVSSSVGSGWYVAQPGAEEASETFEARLVIETGLLRTRSGLSKDGLKRLKAHLLQQRQSLSSGDAGLRSFLLGDFHVCLAECLGNAVLAETLRDLTARTTLIAIEHQSAEDAGHSCDEHAAIFDALSIGRLDLAERLMAKHLGSWDRKLPMKDQIASDRAENSNPLQQLEDVLAPLKRKSAASLSTLSSDAAATGTSSKNSPNARKPRASI